MKPAELDEIRQTIWAEPWKDQQLFPDLLTRAVTELGRIATGDPVRSNTTGWHHFNDAYADWAADLLRTLGDRARTGIPFGEPYGDQPPTNPEDL